MTATEHPLQFLILCGPGDAERATMGLQMAIAAACSGVAVRVFLAHHATAWACAHPPEDEDYAAIHRLLDKIRGLGGHLSCCSACADKHCMTHEEHTEMPELREGVDLAGLVTVTRSAVHGANTLVF
ncbi:MAG: DsrE family protein [Planctomycetes bacterium]|nr:DsrE family protein [Planctomycetota bacterium]MCB9870990.1 DsrE family protein [Planctomycetota bacterium]MCB9888350.1 DsrE family protein [Planctomycetota bacterium]